VEVEDLGNGVGNAIERTLTDACSSQPVILHKVNDRTLIGHRAVDLVSASAGPVDVLERAEQRRGNTMGAAAEHLDCSGRQCFCPQLALLGLQHFVDHHLATPAGSDDFMHRRIPAKRNVDLVVAGIKHHVDR